MQNEKDFMKKILRFFPYIIFNCFRSEHIDDTDSFREKLEREYVSIPETTPIIEEEDDEKEKNNSKF